MLFIISFIVAILILIISIYFFYGRIWSGKEKKSEVKHVTKNLQVDTNVSSQKKNKKGRKSNKNVSNESGGIKTSEEIAHVANESALDEYQNQESIIEPTHNVYQETAKADVENSFSNNEIDFEALKMQINAYEDEIKTLNLKLEEANEKIVSCKGEAESLNEEIKNIKAELNEVERSKSKIEEQLKKAENDNSKSLSKNVELERRLAQNNAENVDLKRKLDLINSELKSEQEKLKSEKEKLKSEKEKLKSLEKEKKENHEENEANNLNHIKMYQQYETKIEKLTAEQKDVKLETVKMNRVLQDKEQNLNQLNEQIQQLNAKLVDSKKENESICGKLQKLSQEFTDKSTEATESKKDNRRLSENLESLKLEIDNKQGSYESKLQKLSEEKLAIQQQFIEDIAKMNVELKAKCEEIEKNEFLSKSVNSYVGEIEQLKKSNFDLLSEMEQLKIDLSQKTEELQLKIQECLEKDARLKEFDCENSKFKSEIDRLHSEISANLDITTENSNLIEEITLLKSASTNKDDELNMKLSNTLKELKEKSCDLSALQDQKMDQLKTIEQLKNELSSRTDKVAELSTDVNMKEIVIKELVNERKNLENKLEKAKLSVATEKDIQLQNSQVTIKLKEVSEQLEMRNNEITKLENEKVQLISDIERIKCEMKENEQSTRQQIYEQQENLDRKIRELNTQNEAYLSIKEKFDALEQKLSDSVVLNSLQPEFSENNFAIEDDIQETRLKPDFQTCEQSNFTSESHTIEEMQSHIDKLQTELLVLQRKYYELKDSSVSHESSNQKSQQNINIYPTDTVSIPPITSEITDKSQSHNHLLESIEKLNIEISEQRLKNQTLDKQFIDKNNEVNALKQCLFGLDGDLLSIEHLALDLQKSYSDSYSEKNKLKSEYNQLSNDYEAVKVKYDNLVKEFKVLKSAPQTHDTSETIILLEDQLKKCQEDNCQLKIQLDRYRETLEKTENCLQNIQSSVDQEESNWKICLKSSEQEQERLEEKIKELLNQIEDLRSQKHSDSSVMISMETPSIANGSLSSETKKKRKRKNKKKKNKNRVTQP